MTQAEHAKILAILEALGSPDRVEIIEVLLRHGPLTHGDLAKRVGRPLGVRHHLTLLQQCGVVLKEEEDRRNVLYRVDRQVFDRVVAYLTRLRDLPN